MDLESGQDQKNPKSEPERNEGFFARGFSGSSSEG